MSDKEDQPTNLLPGMMDDSNDITKCSMHNPPVLHKRRTPQVEDNQQVAAYQQPHPHIPQPPPPPPPVDYNKPIYYLFILAILGIMTYIINQNLPLVLDYNLKAMDKAQASDNKYYQQQQNKDLLKMQAELYKTAPQQVTKKVCHKYFFGWFDWCDTVTEEMAFPQMKVLAAGDSKQGGEGQVQAETQQADTREADSVTDEL